MRSEIEKKSVVSMKYIYQKERPNGNRTSDISRRNKRVKLLSMNGTPLDFLMNELFPKHYRSDTMVVCK